MFLKRVMVLLGGVLLFIVAFVIYSEVSHKRMEDSFREAREKYHMDHVALTSAEPSIPIRAPISTSSTPDSLIGPVPPSAAAAAASSSVPTAAAPAPTIVPIPVPAAAPEPPPAPVVPTPPPLPDTNALPTAPPIPSSTMDYPRASRSPFFQLAAYRPDDAVEMANPTIGAVTNAAPVAPTTNAPSATSTGTKKKKKASTATSSSTNAPAATPTATGTAAATAAPATHPHIEPVAHTSGTAAEGSVIVLLYHQFKPAGVHIPSAFQWTMNEDVFEYEMKYIKDNGYNVIPMDDLIKFMKHEGTVPPKSVVITIDDGYKSAITIGAPILKKYGYPWTYFIYPDFITVNEGAGAASWNDLKQLQAEGVDIESHSMTHPNLKLKHQKIKGTWHNFTDEEYAEWLKNETAGSKALIEQHLGKPVTRFAYPYGEYNKQVEAAAVAAGYEAIFTVADNPVRTTTSLKSIGRYTITQAVEKNFTAYLRQGALGLSNVEPAPGATTSEPRPVISATLGYSGSLDPNSIETSVRDFGNVRHDFDPQTNTLRLYLPRDLVSSVVLVNIRVKDATSGQVMVANWHFNYEADANAGGPAHVPLTPATTSTAPAPATGTPLDVHPTAPAPETPVAPVNTTPAPASPAAPALPKTD